LGWIPQDLEPKKPLHAENPSCERIKMAFADSRSNQDTESKEFEEIERQLKHLLEELKRLEKETEEKVRKEILPHLRREIERLRKWLREFHRKDDAPEPIQT
jgi:hypothetical protein